MDENKVTEEVTNAAETEVSDNTAEVSENTAEAAVETTETSEAVETAEPVAEEAGEAAEETPEEAAEEPTEAEEAAEETSDEAAEEPAEEEKSEEKTSEEEPKAVKAAPKEAPVIKKKKKLDKVNVIVIVVCAVIVVACVLFVGYKEGWFKGKVKSNVTFDDYSVIEIDPAAVEVTDDMVEQYISSLLQSQTITEEETTGVVADGDQLVISYVGTYADTGEQFDGGTADNQSLTIGSGQMIDGFESGLIGAQIGSTVNLELTFPENYQSADLAGKRVNFAVTINSRQKTVVPELTDAFVKEYSANYLDEQLNTVEELEEYVRDYLERYYLHSAMLQVLKDKVHVTSYDEEIEAKLKEFSLQSLDYQAAMYGMNSDVMATYYGYDSADAYATEEAHSYMDIILLVDHIIKEKGITWTQEELDLSIAMYMARNGYSDMYTIEEFKEKSGETWMYLYENLEFKFDLAMDALEDNVVFVEAIEENTSETATETTTAESATK